MADYSTTKCPSLPSNYVSINDLRDRWLKKQQQKQPQHQQEEQVRIETTMREKGKEKVQEATNYVTIVDLRDRWLKQQQQQKEENDRIETRKRDKGKEILQEVTVDCQFDGISDKKNPHSRNPNPNLIPERGFYKNPKEKAQVTVDFQVEGNSDKNSPHFRNSNPNLIREREFRRNPNWSNWMPIHRGFHGGEKISTQNQAVKASSSSLVASETSDGVDIGKESVDDGAEMKDAPLMSKDEETLRNRIWKKERLERKQFAKEKGENEEMIKLNVSTQNQAVKASSSSLEALETNDGVKIESESIVDGRQLKDAPLMSKDEKNKLKRGILHKKRKERKQIAKKEKENEEMIKLKLNVSKIGAVGEKTREIETKMKEINLSKIGATGENTREIEAKMKEINVSKIGGIAEKTRETEAKTKDINVSQIWRKAEKTKETEAKIKDINVSKMGRIAKKTRGTKVKMKDINVLKIKGIGERTREIEAKMKEMTVREEPSPDKAKKEVVLAEKSVLMSKNVGEVRWGDRMARTPRWANTGEGNRGDKGGLIWVKKAEGADKVLSNGCHH